MKQKRKKALHYLLKRMLFEKAKQAEEEKSLAALDVTLEKLQNDLKSLK